jgi:RHS repeat-associated protein
MRRKLLKAGTSVKNRCLAALGISPELNPTSSAWTDYILGYGGRVAKDTSTNGSGAQYFHTDQIDSTRLVTDNTGAVVWSATYSPFGQELSAQNSAITFQFAGMQYDAETNLNHTDFRQYASSEGRWLSPDPYLGSLNPGNPQSFNRYTYVLNNPLNLSDPSGLDCIYGAADSTANGTPPKVVRGDCYNDEDNGFFVDGTVTDAHYQPNGDVFYSYYLNADNAGSGVIGLAPYDPGAAISEITRLEWQKRKAQERANAADIPLNPFALAVGTEVGLQTGWYTKQINCGAGFLYPFIPGPKPEDLTHLIGIEGGKGAGDLLDHAADNKHDQAQKLARAKKKGTASAARVAEAESGAIRDLGHLATGVGYAFAAHEGYENWKECQAGRGPGEE